MERTLFKNHIKNVTTFTTTFLIVTYFFAFVYPIQPVLADPPVWTNLSYTMNDGCIDFVFPCGTPVIMNVTNATYASNFMMDMIPVLITSTEDPTGITLILTENAADDGIFGNTNLIFMRGNDLFTTSGSATITITDPLANTNSSTIQFLTDPFSVQVSSTSDPAGFVPTLTETGQDTGVFAATIHFSTTGTDIATNTILVAGGNIVSITDQVTGEFTNGLIIPNPISGIGAIRAADGANAVTATYLGFSTPVDIVTSSNPGRGGGGLVPPSVVFDVLAAVGGGGGGHDRTAPSITFSKSLISSLPLVGDILDSILAADPFTPMMPISDSSIEAPLKISNNGYIPVGYSQTIETTTVKTGTTLPIELIMHDESGIGHVALYTNVGGAGGEIQNSDTYIIYDKDKPIEIADPHGFFSDVKLTTSKENVKYKFHFDLTFVKPMGTSDIIFRVWDEKRNSEDIKFFDAIRVDGEPIINSSAGNLVYSEASGISIPYYKFPQYTIPLADYDGNIIYHNSFGDLEQKQIHPYHEPATYPDNLGRAERHDNGFQEAIAQEATKAQTLLEKLIGNPFTEVKDRSTDKTFFYPSTAGRLDRKNIDTLSDVMMKEQAKATKTCSKLYKTNHVED